MLLLDEVQEVGRIGAALYEYFGIFFQEGLPVVPEAFTVLNLPMLEID